MQAHGELIFNLTKVFSQLPTGKLFSALMMQDISQVILDVFGLYEGERCQQLKQRITRMSEIFRLL